MLHKFLACCCLAILCLFAGPVCAQVCTTLGQNPSTAFPVCGTTAFEQDQVPQCNSTSLFVPGCDDGAAYANQNPFWYRFHCYVAGSFGFIITPADLQDDYDWQLYDITGLNPDDVYTNRNIIIAGNWAGTVGRTGASAAGTHLFECASNPADGINPFSSMPLLIQEHDYILLVSHYNDSQSGYELVFGNGTSEITDTTQPRLKSATADCDGTKIRVKLNKAMRCSSLTGTGSEFSLSPAGATILSASAANCSDNFDFDELEITLSAPLAAGTYQLFINNGTDGTTVLDNCDQSVPLNDSASFIYTVPQPVFADSVGTPGCAPTSILLHFPKRINCTSIAPDGSDFSITGPSTVTIESADANCTNGLSDEINISFTSPILVGGTYTLSLHAGTDGTTVVDECGLESPVQTLTFTTVDTVNADFSYINITGCSTDTLNFSHDGAHGVNSWNWIMNGEASGSSNQFQVLVSATSNNHVQLIVSNGICADTATQTIVIDNQVVAAFDMPSIICPEDPLVVTNLSTGNIDTWRWNFDLVSTSTERDPAPVQFPSNNTEAFYTVKLVATNFGFGCVDSVRKGLRVLSNCLIEVPTGFTPNNDGVNDFLAPNNALKAQDMDFRVYNRWGQVVFQSKDWTSKWDGKVNGIEQGSGVYVWFLRYTNRDTGKQVMQKGTTTLIR